MIRLVKRSTPGARWVFTYSDLAEVGPFLATATTRSLVEAAEQRGLEVHVWQQSHVIIHLGNGWGIRLAAIPGQAATAGTRAWWTDGKGSPRGQVPVSEARQHITQLPLMATAGVPR